MSAKMPVSVNCLDNEAISSMQSGGKIGGSRFMKKSLSAVATAFTGMSRSAMLISESI